ncbi:MAG: hypothetical protein HY644_06070 [Acidobacteria bacterium]|nr:hypothetical protein [Acidobacteriota bacterium]
MGYNYYNYFTEIEEYFVRKRGKHMLVSPLDWSLIESWKQIGIPLHVVFRGIDRAFEKHQAHASEKRINSIFYCQPTVTECFDEYRQAAIGGPEQRGGNKPEYAERVLATMRGLAQRLDAVSSAFLEAEVLDRARQLLGELLKEINTAGPPAMPAIEDTLKVCDSLLLESGRRNLDSAAIEAFHREARQELRIYKRKVSPEMYSRIEKNFINRKIRETCDIPEFTLFFLS